MNEFKDDGKGYAVATWPDGNTWRTPVTTEELKERQEAKTSNARTQPLAPNGTIWQGTGANGEKIEVKVRDKRKGSAERLALLYEGSAQTGQMSMQGFPSESEATKWFIGRIAVPYSKGRIDRTHVEVLKRMKFRHQSAKKKR